MISAVQLYQKLHDAYGQPRWWSKNPYLVMVQSVLVQNTSWTSVNKVTGAMPELLTPLSILNIQKEELENRIRPCGFSRRKAAAIRLVTERFGRYGFDAAQVRLEEKNKLREELLSLKGIGAETADVILVYAFYKPSFIIDAYTRRFLERLGFAFESDTDIRLFFESGLENDAQLYGWYHWLILEHGIGHCRKTPNCRDCPLESLCIFWKKTTNEQKDF